MPFRQMDEAGDMHFIFGTVYELRDIKGKYKFIPLTGKQPVGALRCKAPIYDAHNLVDENPDVIVASIEYRF